MFAQKANNDARTKSLRSRISGTAKRLERMAGVNKALRLGLLPRIVAKILHELDRVGLLGEQVIIAGGSQRSCLDDK